MATVRALVLRAPGTNCDVETAYALEQAGADVERRHVFALREQPEQLDRFQLLVIPGGFSYGDDIAAGKVFALELSRYLKDAVLRLHARGGLILGICNGFQVLVKAGLLPDPDTGAGRVTLSFNDSGRFEDRWVWLQVRAGNSPFLAGLDRLHLPVAHAEGRFTVRTAEDLTQILQDGSRGLLRYSAPPGVSADGVPYPWNPNGSEGDVAGLADRTGRILGLMPHPERHVLDHHHPRWTRSDPDRGPLGSGRRIFENAVRWLRAG